MSEETLIFFLPYLLNPWTIWCPDISLMLGTTMPQTHGITLIAITTTTLGFSQARGAY